MRIPIVIALAALLGAAPLLACAHETRTITTTETLECADAEGYEYEEDAEDYEDELDRDCTQIRRKTIKNPGHALLQSGRYRSQSPLRRIHRRCGSGSRSIGRRFSRTGHFVTVLRGGGTFHSSHRSYGRRTCQSRNSQKTLQNQTFTIVHLGSMFESDSTQEPFGRRTSVSAGQTILGAR